MTALLPNPGFLAAAATNSSVNAVTRSLTVELAPLRLNAISPSTIDSGAWDGPDEKKGSFLAITQTAVFAMTSTFTPSGSLAIDGGQPPVLPFRTSHGPSTQVRTRNELGRLLLAFVLSLCPLLVEFVLGGAVNVADELADSLGIGPGRGVPDAVGPFVCIMQVFRFLAHMTFVPF
ncbi:hypothetical protein [Streptomyces sp. NBC_00842]|uniref:hypothetical protein n=1 Tax=Streptomyces sp. NBC_00842 TaxID=2975848 RepID=UPI003867A340|nr:hypothetical protein OH821_01920 [Streptomyces sp. NBC_00842]